MNNFVFKIFGAPGTFDLYQGSEGEIRYFQNFDNGGKENAKLTIHRMVSGKVSYSYLRYNFLSSGGRPNSFFGMSVVFDNAYCKDIERLFELFDVVYTNIILKNGILLTEAGVEKNSKAQAKFLVNTFSEAEAEVRNVEKNIVNNIKNYFADAIIPMDDTFLESNSMVQLNDKVGNAKFEAALRKYTWVHISSDYSKNEDPIPNPEFLNKLDNTINIIQKQIPILSVNVVKGVDTHKEATDSLSKIEKSLGDIDAWLVNKYNLKKGATVNALLQKQPELKKRYDSFEEMQRSLKDLLTVIGVPMSPLKTNANSSEYNESELPKPDFTEPPVFAISPVWREHGLKIIIGIAFLVVFSIAGNFIFNPPDDEIPAVNLDDVKIKKNIKEGNELLQNNKFDEAISKFKEVGETNLVKTVNERAVEYWYAKADTTDLKLRKKYLENAKKYGGYPSTDDDIAEIQNLFDSPSPPVIPKTRKSTGGGRQSQVTKPVEPQPKQIDCSSVKIHLSPNEVYRNIGSEFSASAMSGITLCVGGEWQCEEGLVVTDKTKNPVKVKIKSRPEKGTAALRYLVGGTQVGAVLIKIINNK